MRDKFAEFIEHTDSEKRDIWEHGIFVFDTNVLLGLYRYSKTTRNDILDNIKAVKDRVWLPHQVAAEYFRNRCNTVYSQRKVYQDIEQSAGKFIKEIVGKLRLQEDEPDIECLKKYISKWISDKRTENLICETHSEDQILDELLEIFDKKIGEPYSPDDVQRIEKDGEKRYKSKTPPGYMDGQKGRDDDSNNKYGDLILWLQIIDFAKTEKKDIIFVTDDRKEDFWERVQGETIGARHELKRELLVKANVRLSMYTTVSFLNESGRKIDNKTISEIQKAMHEPKVPEEKRSGINVERAVQYGTRNSMVGLNAALQSAIDYQNRMQDMAGANAALQSLADYQNQMQDMFGSGIAMQRIIDQENQMRDIMGSNNAIQRVIDQESRIQNILGSSTVVQSILDRQNRAEDMLGMNRVVQGLTEQENLIRKMSGQGGFNSNEGDINGSDDYPEDVDSEDNSSEVDNN